MELYIFENLKYFLLRYHVAHEDFHDMRIFAIPIIFVQVIETENNALARHTKTARGCYWKNIERVTLKLSQHILCYM